MDGVGISIIERPRPLPGHDTPNPTQHPYTLKCEEPVNDSEFAVSIGLFMTWKDGRWIETGGDVDNDTQK